MNARWITLVGLALSGLAFADESAAQAAAESAFEAVMSGNEVSNYRGGGARSPATAVDLGPAVEPAPVPKVDVSGAGGQVEVPLERYEAIRRSVIEQGKSAISPYSTLVALGGSSYEGFATPAGLSLRLRLDVTLRAGGAWKTVPLVGQEVAVVSAKVAGKAIPLGVQNGYQVWVTDTAGEATVDIELLVPATGPRGSLEYEFLVPRTPVTRFDCRFAGIGIEPRLTGAVREERTENAGSTTLQAWLAPTSRIHLVGYHANGDGESRDARVYAETLSLLSIEERTVELFTVMRYSILEAGIRNFDIQVPAGFDVVSADGAGAFRYTLEAAPQGTIIHGETAFAIRDAYEVSLRLERSSGDGKLAVSPPHAIGAERETGWIGLETIGTMQVEDTGGISVVDVSVAQLPAELVQNAVSPVLEGWRYHEDGATVQLLATNLPERDPAAGAIDTLNAVTVIAPEGGTRTTVTMTLRNRLRHSLGIRLPDGVEIRASRLDGVAVVPSKTADGRVLLPLKRSAGTDRPVPFTVELELVGEARALSWVGLASLALPQIELPISTMDWAVRAPAANRYTDLYGDISPQADVGRSWEDTPSTRRMTYKRFWVRPDAVTQVRFGHIRGWLLAPLGLFAAAVGALGARRVVRSSPPGSRARAIGGTALGVYGLGLGWVGGVEMLGIAVLLSCFSTGIAGEVLGFGFRALQRFREPGVSQPPRAGSWRARGIGGRFLLLSFSAMATFLWLIVGVRFAYVAMHPW